MEGPSIPRANKTAQTTPSAGTGSAPESSVPQEYLDLEKKKLAFEKERAVLQSELGRQQAEAERDLLRETLEKERQRANGFMEQTKQQNELLRNNLSRTAEIHPEEKTDAGTSPGCVTELVGYHALKKISGDIVRSIGNVVGVGNDVRILIVDRLDYATGDIPYVEVTSQLSVFEVRCRKQIAINKELADLAVQLEDRAEEERIPAAKTGTTRLAPLATSPSSLPAINAGASAAPSMYGVIAATADLAGSSRDDYSARGQDLSLKTEGLVAAVAGALRSEKRYVYVNNFYSLDTTGPQSKLMNMYAGVLDCSSRLAQSRNRLQYSISKKAGLVAELKVSLTFAAGGAPSKEREEEISRIREAIRDETGWLDRAMMEVLASDAIHAELGVLVKNITTGDPAQPASKLALAVFREKVHELGITHLLYIGVLTSGGESVTRKWILGTGTTSYLGGAVVSYVLSRVEGDILASDILPVMYSFGFDPAGQRHSPLKQIRFEKQEPKK